MSRQPSGPSTSSLTNGGREARAPTAGPAANVRTTFAKIVRRAGVEPWPRLWHSLRASCESDLAQSFPLATVTKWLGNTPSVALRHYVDPTEVAFDRALDWRPKSGAKSGSRRRKKRRSGATRPTEGNRRFRRNPLACKVLCETPRLPAT